MKESKRALRRWKSECKFEKRINIWVPGSKSQLFIGDNGFECMSSADLKKKIRDGKFWTFLKWTSTPCSCSMCSYPKYKRTPKSKVSRQIWDDIQDDLAS
jgi:hypothetical protein